MQKTSIVILTTGKNEHIKKCVDSIQRHTQNYEIIVVDNGSAPAYSGPGVVIRNQKNLGFPAGVNQGIKKATGDVIVFLNDDTVVPPLWQDHLFAHFGKYDMVGPVSNSVSGPQCVKGVIFNPKKKLDDIANFTYEENKGQSFPWHRLVFFCVAIKKAVIDKIGLLDERFTPGNFEDDDFCLRAIDAGFRLGVARDVFIFHAGGSTFLKNPEGYQKLLNVNKIKFDQKWPEKKYKELVVRCVQNVDLGNNKQICDMALVMVVKNEGGGLEQAILSARPYVQKIVIAIDDSSSDRTEKIARQYADVVKMYKWRDDFSHARNFAHAGVKSKWIIFLDGHEEIKVWPDLSKLLDSDKDGFLVTVKMENGVVFRALRIYKNGCQFEGAYHEIVNCANIGDATKLSIIHNRINTQSQNAIKEREKQRNFLIPNVLGKQFERDKKNVRASFHLAMHAQSMKDFKSAFKYQSAFLKYAKKKSERWFIYFNRAICYLALGHLFRAYWAISLADLETPGRWEVSKMKGLIFFQRGWHQNAIENFIESFKINTGDVSFCPWERDDGGTWNLIGECFFRQKKYFEAGAAFARASEIITDSTLKDLCKKRSALMYQMCGIK